MAKAFIGCSGWNYRHWGEGVFYPPGIRQADWLDYYSRHFRTVEINNTFYRLPEQRVFVRWRETVPQGFIYAVKASRFITHVKRLQAPEVAAAKFLERVSALKQTLGPLLFQLPPSYRLDLGRLRHFLDYLRAQTLIPDLQAVFEFRDPTWLSPKAYDALKEAGVGLCLSDWPEVLVEGPITADFVYIRRHGPGRLYASPYSQEELKALAGQVQGWLGADKDVYVYFNNDAGGFAVKNALSLLELLRVEKIDPIF